MQPRLVDFFAVRAKLFPPFLSEGLRHDVFNRDVTRVDTGGYIQNVLRVEVFQALEKIAPVFETEIVEVSREELFTEFFVVRELSRGAVSAPEQVDDCVF